jgi:hypothetical protein
MKAIQRDFSWGPAGGGISFYPYQMALEVSIRYWPCVFAPSVRLHIGPLKLWCYLRLNHE